MKTIHSLHCRMFFDFIFKKKSIFLSFNNLNFILVTLLIDGSTCFKKINDNFDQNSIIESINQKNKHNN